MWLNQETVNILLERPRFNISHQEIIFNARILSCATDLPPVNAVLDAWTVLAYLGAKTKKIVLAPGVIDTQRFILPRQPASS